MGTEVQQSLNPLPAKHSPNVYDTHRNNQVKIAPQMLLRSVSPQNLFRLPENPQACSFQPSKFFVADVGQQITAYQPSKRLSPVDQTRPIGQSNSIH